MFDPDFEALTQWFNRVYYIETPNSADPEDVTLVEQAFASFAELPPEAHPEVPCFCQMDYQLYIKCLGRNLDYRQVRALVTASKTKWGRYGYLVDGLWVNRMVVLHPEGDIIFETGGAEA